jgi:anhydro-N-acetylmuramic acid kinase
MDGVDVGLTQIEEPAPDQFVFKPLFFATYPYPSQLENELRQLVATGKTTLEKLTRVQATLSHVFAQAFIRALKKSGIPRTSIEAIGSHGQSIYHLPPRKTAKGYSWQIGHPAIIAEQTEIDTIGDFRIADMAQGGWGAPLAPIFHYYFLKQSGTSAVVANIGGISNISMVDPASGWSSLRGFDSGPGNTLIDRTMQKFYHKNYDKNGACARRGTICQSLVDRLLRASFFRQRGPKSSGLEFFSEKYLDQFLASARKLCKTKEDMIATVTALTSHSLAQHIKPFLRPDLTTVILCGGGAKNLAIRDQLKALLPSDAMLTTFNSGGLSSDAVEANLFAFLAFLNRKRRALDLKNITGARRPSVLGVSSLIPQP